MKSIACLAFTVAFLFSCNDHREMSATNFPEKFKKSTGEQIPIDVALEWTRAYKHTFNGGREGNEYSISKTALVSLLGDHAGKVGVALHHGTDSSQHHHILISPVMENSEVWSTPYAVDSNTGNLISTAAAENWAGAYSSSHPNEIWFHFFGIDVFTEIRTNPAFNYIIIKEGLNEKGPQLLLFVYNTSIESNGRANSDEVTVYDVSSQCPPCEPN